jgi:hypothetical protein
MKAQGMRPVDIAKALQIGRASVYRVLGQKADNLWPVLMPGNDR